MAIAGSYVIAFVIFATLDLLYLSMIGVKFFRDALGDMIVANVRLAPAVVFYLIYPAGLVYFAIAPALREGTLPTALMHGAMFGFMAYATYDLTNYATLRNWTLGLTLLDLAYGTALTALTSGATYLIVTRLGG